MQLSILLIIHSQKSQETQAIEIHDLGMPPAGHTIDTLRVAKSGDWVQEAVDVQDRLASDKRIMW